MSLNVAQPDVQTRRGRGPCGYDAFRNVRRFGSLDGWRAVAILAVIWHHTCASRFSWEMLHEGRQGVNLFFVISGFLIVTLILRERDATGRFSLPAFWHRRILRIFPVYFLVLDIYILLVVGVMHNPAGERFLHNLPYFATFTSNWAVAPTGETIFFFAWSVAQEEQFYLVWPVLELVVKVAAWRVGLLLAATCAVFACGYLTDAHIGGKTVEIIGRIPPCILLGTLLAYLLHHRRSYDLAARVLGRRGSALACLLLTVASLLSVPLLDRVGETFIALAFAALIGACVIREDNDLAPVLHWRPLVWIGTVSYGMYMMHMLAANVVVRLCDRLHLDQPLALFAGTAALACLFASVSLVVYERPFLKLKNRRPQTSQDASWRPAGGLSLRPVWWRQR